MLTAVAQTEAAHFGKCPVCGALVDMQDLAQVMAKRGSRINPERQYSAYQAVFVAKLSRPHTVYSADIAPRPVFTAAKPSGDIFRLAALFFITKDSAQDAKGLVV